VPALSPVTIKDAALPLFLFPPTAEYIGMECPIQPDRQNQGERIPRKMDLHDYYAFVDIQVDSKFYLRLSGNLRNTSARSDPYRQTDKTREKEFTEGWTFTPITPL
jgi:hypothetical protein